MTDSRRLFNANERRFFFLMAEGHCTGCGVVLTDENFEADHVEPWSLGGPTRLSNGQALCRTCNRRKSNTAPGLNAATLPNTQGNEESIMRPLRNWQAPVVESFQSGLPTSYLMVACPGAGKTVPALRIAKQALNRGEIKSVFVLCPTTSLKEQWVQAAQTEGIQLAASSTGQAANYSSKDGAVVTFAQVARQDWFWTQLIESRGPSLVILDEVHHIGAPEHSSWGASIPEAVASARCLLALSGTPFRSGGARIPFVNYDEDGFAISDFALTYGEALKEDPQIVRPIGFELFDADVSWLRGNEWTQVRLSEALTTEEERRSRRLVLHPNGDWLAEVLRKADEQLDKHRVTYPVAGGLVFAVNVRHAQDICLLLQQIAPGQVSMAVSGTGRGSHFEGEPMMGDEVIKAFREGNSRWLVTVKMVAEGVDIPRLTVGVWATIVRTEMMFMQGVGRFIRYTPDAPDIQAALFVPADSAMQTMCAQIEEGCRVPLEEDTTPTDPSEEEREERFGVNVIDFVAAEPDHIGTMTKGQLVVDIAAYIRRTAQIPVDEALVADLLRQAAAAMELLE